MKIFCIILLSALMIRCQESEKYQHYHSRHKPNGSRELVSSNVIGASSNGVAVNKIWMSRYEKDEKIHGKIPADDWIKKEGDLFIIPTEVGCHSIEMAKKASE